MNEKPLEFKIEKRYNVFENTDYNLIFYYENGDTYEIQLDEIPKGLELNKHYSIADIYGYPVVDDRKGL